MRIELVSADRARITMLSGETLYASRLVGLIEDEPYVWIFDSGRPCGKYIADELHRLASQS